MKKYKNIILSILIPIIIMIIILIFNGFYPFKDKIILMLDGFNQYPGFLNNFKETLLSNQSIFYSFKGLLGFNSYASNVYYTLNITNILYLFFSKNTIIDFYTISIIIKFSLCSLTMLLLLNYFKKNKYNYIFSICYALSSYNLLYYLNYMWFDSIILLPFVILGIEKIFKENKYLTYIISLSLAIFCNFYIGYMICIFSLIYFITKYFINNNKNKKIIIKYILSSILAGLLTSFVTLPVLLELLNGKSSLFTNYTNSYFKFDLDFINVFYKLTFGSFSNGDLEYGNPNVYVGLFIYINTILYFFNKNISLKTRLINLGIFLFFLLSMSFNLLDYFWQMMQMPIWYPVRYAFIFDLFIIILAFNNYYNLDNISKKKKILLLLLILTLSIIGFFTSGNLKELINLKAKIIYLGISILFIIYYFVLIYNKELKKLLYFLIIIELALNAFVTFKNNGNDNSYKDFTNNQNIINNQIINDNTFYRLTTINKTIKNNGLLNNYNDINYFSSIRNKNSYELFKKLGIKTIDDCNTDYYYNNPIINALFNIKYYISSSENNYYEIINNYNNTYLYKNNDSASLGFITTNKIKDLKLTNNYIDNLNNLHKTITNSNNIIIKEIKLSDATIKCSINTCITYGHDAYIKYNFKNKKDSFLIIQDDNTSSKDTKYDISINNKNYNEIDMPYLIRKKDNINITIKPDGEYKDYNYHVYLINYSEYQKFIKNINNNKAKIYYINDSNIVMKVETNNNEILFTSIENDNGWKIFVDNKETTITPIMDGLIGIKLSEGKHTIKFKFYPPGLNIGIIISSISLIIILLIKKH